MKRRDLFSIFFAAIFFRRKLDDKYVALIRPEEMQKLEIQYGIKVPVCETRGSLCQAIDDFIRVSRRCPHYHEYETVYGCETSEGHHQILAVLNT
ncbi:hypothetical protein EBT16_07235 [bacterium]|nr:hypothetical protein [bacterium]